MPTPTDPYAIPEAPDWLDSSNATDPLENELDNTDKYYDVSKYLKSMNKAASAQFGMDLQEGQYAAGEATARAIQNGTQGSVNTSQIAAQTALPGMQAKLDTKAKGAEIALNAQIANQQARANLAQSIASTRSQYASTLANYISTIRGQNISGFNASQSNAVAQQNATNGMNSIYAQLLAAPGTSADVKAWARAQMGVTGGSGVSDFAGYLPNAGPLVPGSRYGTTPRVDLWT